MSPELPGTGPPISPTKLAVLEFVFAFAIAGIAAYLIWTHLPEQLDVQTDIVGFPIHSNFNPYVYFWRYWLLVAFVPIVGLGLVLLLSKLIPGGAAWRGPRALHPAAEPAAPEPADWQVAATGIGRTLFVGAIFGLELAIAAFNDTSWLLSVGVPVTAGYTLLASLVAVAVARLRRRPTDFWARLALVNAFAVPFCFAGLYAVSRATQVTIRASGEVHEYPWLPGWLALVGTAGLLAWAIAGARRADSLHTHEGRLLLIVAGPVALLLFLAALPGVLGGIDMFHEGEALAGAQLTDDGAFPWRDLIFIHGLLADVAMPDLGFAVFEDSRWGFVAGNGVLVAPLYWISTYYLCAYLFRRNWLFLVGTQAAVVLGVMFEAHLRFLLVPVALLLLAALLDKPSPLRAAAFTAVVFVQAIVTPEAGIGAVALLGTVVLFDLCYFQRRRGFVQNFRRTLLCAASGATLSILWLGFLGAFGALDDFVFAYTTFAADHQLTGSFPITWLNDRFRFDAIAPVVLVALAILYFGIQILRGRALSVADWTMGAVAIFTGLYYHKFLARPDQHVYQSFAVAIPLVYYVLYRLIGLGEQTAGRLRAGLRLPTRVGLTAVAVTVLVLEAPLSLGDVVPNASKRLDGTVPAEASVPRAGYTTFDGAYEELVGNLDTIIDAYAGPRGGVFDFSNSPALFYYLLDQPSPTRYYHVSMAIRAGTQDDLVDELSRRRPKLVVYSSYGTGLPSWDYISNQVRHYRVSRYLLDNYVPLSAWNGFVFLGLKGARFPSASSIQPKLEGNLPLVTDDLYIRTQPCDWGYAPNFLVERPTDGSLARPLSLGLSRLASLQGWAVDLQAKKPAVRVLAVFRGKVIAETRPFAARSDVSVILGSDSYRTSGYKLPTVTVPGGTMRDLRVYALTRSGAATQLAYGPAVPAEVGEGAEPRTLLRGGRRIPVVPGAAQGFVDSASFPDHRWALSVPPGTSLGAYHWAELETSTPPQENHFMLNDGFTDLDRGIFFKTLARGKKSVRVDLGSCSQWRAFHKRKLFLGADRSEPLTAVRLYR